VILNWHDPNLQPVLRDADLSVTVPLWHPSFDPLTAPRWWHWREQCDCPDTSFGRNPHRWDCALTPIWERTMRDGYTPSMAFGGTR
jgi:hypothetical protein